MSKRPIPFEMHVALRERDFDAFFSEYRIDLKPDLTTYPIHFPDLVGPKTQIEVQRRRTKVFENNNGGRVLKNFLVIEGDLQKNLAHERCIGTIGDPNSDVLADLRI